LKKLRALPAPRGGARRDAGHPHFLDIGVAEGRAAQDGRRSKYY